MPFGTNDRGPVVIGVLLLVVLAGCAGGGGGNAGGPGGPNQGAAAADGSEGGSFYAEGERIVVREASMAVEVESFDPAFDRARAVARDHGGFVADWNHDVERGWHSADLRIRVPAENFGEARDDLADLGTVEEENVAAEDFTGSYQDLGARLADLRQERDELRTLLERTEDPEAAREIQRDLADVRAQIRELESRREGIERQEALSTIRLSLHEPESARPPRNYESAFGFDDAFLDAFYGGLVTVKYVIVLFGYAIPIGIAIGLFGSAAFVWWRIWGTLQKRLADVLPRAPSPLAPFDTTGPPRDAAGETDAETED